MTKSYNRIYICGVIGSGKSTLASKLSEQYNLPIFVTDDFTYVDKNYEKKNSEAVRTKKLLECSKKPKWIIEGCHRQDWVESGFKRAEIIYILRPSFCRVSWQMLRRYVKEGKPGTFRKLLLYYWWLFKGQKRFINSYKKRATKVGTPFKIIKK